MKAVLPVFRKCVPPLLAAVLLLASSCASHGPKSGIGRKFDEAASADLILRYCSDQTIFMLKPDGHEGVFYRIFDRDEICALDASRAGGRNLAVVVIGFNRTPAVESQIMDKWTATLADLNYRRVVFLRFRENEAVDGMRVVDERNLAAAELPAAVFRVALAAP